MTERRGDVMARHSKAHPGFKAVAAKIGKKYGIAKRGAAILAASTRKASAAAKAKNPRLKRVKMPKKGK